jgi:ribonuclease P protein component
VNRNFRLTQSTEFKRVRRYGKSYAHPLLVLVLLPNDDEKTRVGVIAGRAIGNAVQRNRAKRLLREALRPILTQLRPGWKIVVISRKPILAATLPEIQASLRKLLTRASVIITNNE